MEKNDPDYWENLLNSEGMPNELPSDESMGHKIALGDGFGRKTDKEEDIEDNGYGHSTMCPIRLGHGLNYEINQPNARPVEDEVEATEE